LKYSIAEAHGRLIDNITLQPISDLELIVLGDDISSAKNVPLVEICKTRTDNNGNFLF